MFGTILGYVDVITLGIDIGTELVYVYGYLDVYNNINLEGLLIGYSLGYTDCKVLGSDEGIKLGFSDSELLGMTLVDVDVITLGIDVRTELQSLDGLFDGSDDGNS